MAFKDKHDVWSKDDEEGWGWSGWLIGLLFVVPWLVGLGVIIATIFDL